MSNEEREKDVTFLLTFANRLNDGEHPKGKPKGFILVVAEGDGTFTHHIADPDDGMEWMAVIGNIEVTKQALISTKLSWEPVHEDGRNYSEDELEAFFEDVDEEEGDD